MIKVVAADDHLIFLEGIKSLLLGSSTIHLLEACTDGDQLLALIAKYTPDVALIDISMPGASAESIIQSAEASDVPIKLIALTMHLEPNRAYGLLKLGLNGYVVKDAAFEELESAIVAVAGGDEYVSPAIVMAMHQLDGKDSEAPSVFLTDRELEIVKCLSEGMTNKMVARQLGITERTVRFHVANCCLKLNACRRSHVVAKAIQLKLV